MNGTAVKIILKTDTEFVNMENPVENPWENPIRPTKNG